MTELRQDELTASIYVAKAIEEGRAFEALG
jgi:hypothetical protein